MTVVVGVDRTEGSFAALRFALDEAAVRRATLLVVSAWEVPYELPHSSAREHHDLRTRSARQATELAEHLVAEAQHLRSAPGPSIEIHVEEGIAEDVLLANAEHADLLVVGRNKGGLLRRLALGSVSSRMVHAAQCPVVVVPSPHGAARHEPFIPMDQRARETVAT